MCYLIEKRMNKTGCIALQTEPGEEMAKLLLSVDPLPMGSINLIIL